MIKLADGTITTRHVIFGMCQARNGDVFALALAALHRAADRSEADPSDVMTKPRSSQSSAIDASNTLVHIASLDWASIASELTNHGCAMIGPLLTSEQCEHWQVCTTPMSSFAAES